jgi:hypothetical protein
MEARNFFIAMAREADRLEGAAANGIKRYERITAVIKRRTSIDAPFRGDLVEPIEVLSVQAAWKANTLPTAGRAGYFGLRRCCGRIDPERRQRDSID